MIDPCEIRKRSGWERHGSWAILLLVAFCVGQACFQAGTYVMHESMQKMAARHQLEIQVLKDHQLKQHERWLLQMERYAPKRIEERLNVEERPTSGSAVEQPRKP